MATFWHSTNKKGSETVQDYLCITCQEKTIEEKADFYCKSCMNFYCQKCIYKHDLLFTKHFLYGRGDIKAWPVDEKMEDFLLKCENHKEEKLTMFCEDHSQPCCCNCAVLQHSLCKKVTLISDYVKNISTDLQQLSVNIQTILEEIKKLQDNHEASIRSVHSSYDAQLNKIQATRRKINEVLDEIEKGTRNAMKDILTKLQASLKGDVDTCATLRDELKQLRDATQEVSVKSKRELSFIASRKCQDKIQQSEDYLKKNNVRVQVSITFQPAIEIFHYLFKVSGLGRIEKRAEVLTVQKKPQQGDQSSPVPEYVPLTLNDFELRREQIDLQDALGSGHFATVCIGTCRQCDGKQIPVSVKAMKHEIDTPNDEGYLLKEAEIMMPLSHKHIVRMIGFCKADSMMLVLEYAPLGPLSTFLTTHKNVSQASIVLLLWQVAMGMEYLESKNIVHRNLAARSILLVSETYAKISDFGMSKALKGRNDFYEAQDEGNWPLKCYPPECIYYWTFDSTSDVWSYGVTMWEATSYGEKPYKGKRGQEILKFLIEDGKRMEKPPLCDEDVYDVMLGCWEYEKELRLKFAEIVSVMGSIHKRMINRETGT